MNDTLPKGYVAPIVEAVLDIDCDMLPGFDLAKAEAQAKSAFASDYPQPRRQFLHEHRIEAQAEGPPSMSTRGGLQALQFLKEDQKQLVQIRNKGFSFNRLAPYSSLDDYLPEIERTWASFVALASPLMVESIRLRYINRILLPIQGRIVNLDTYLKIAPRLPDEDRLTFLGFLHQDVVSEPKTGNRAKILLTSQSEDAGHMVVIFDIETSREMACEPSDWRAIWDGVTSLRSLNHLVFRGTLTDKCLSLFRH